MKTADRISLNLYGRPFDRLPIGKQKAVKELINQINQNNESKQNFI
jgi:hypothetical protein